MVSDDIVLTTHDDMLEYIYRLKAGDKEYQWEPSPRHKEEYCLWSIRLLIQMRHLMWRILCSFIT